MQTSGSGEAFYDDASEPVSGDVDPSKPLDWDHLLTAA
jgi:hypothetical protein